MSEALIQTKQLEVCLGTDSGVMTRCAECDAELAARKKRQRICSECGAVFEAKNKRQHCCSDKCRQKAYRKSPAYKAILYKKRRQRWAPRNERFQQRNRYRSLAFDGRYEA
jgi:hypothetical protein